MVNNQLAPMCLIFVTMFGVLNLVCLADVDLRGSVNRKRVARTQIRDDFHREPDVAQCPPDEGCNEYVTYRKGSDIGWPPVVISAPHAGTIVPESLPNRTAGCWDHVTSQCVWTHDCGEKNETKCKAILDGDYATFNLASLIRRHLCQLFGGYCPALINNNIARLKFDANREKPEATLGLPELEAAFDKYAEYIKDAKETVLRQHGAGLFFDIHGHRHSIQRAELGYLLNGTEFDSGQRLDYRRSSIRGLAERLPDIDFDDLIRGNLSFGAILETYGYRAVPSPSNWGPGKGNLYFRGGYLTRQYGSLNGGSFDAIQIESAVSHREPGAIDKYAAALAKTIRRFVCRYYTNQQAPRSADEALAVGCREEDVFGGQYRTTPVSAFTVLLAITVYVAQRL